jgi:Predicted small integral membrane protein
MATEGQEHPIGVYLKIWILLFVLSVFSYMVDFYQLQGLLRWSLILIFMFLKAGFIMAIFMHMVWERMALVVALLSPMIAVLVFIAIMGYESEYTQTSRDVFFDDGKPDKVWAVPHSAQK